MPLTAFTNPICNAQRHNHMTTINVPAEGQILSAIPLPMIVVDVDGTISFANDAAEAFFGRSRKRLLETAAFTVLQFRSDRLNAAIKANESDLSAQNMELIIPAGQAHFVDLTITTLSPSGNRLFLLVPRPNERDQLSERSDDGQQQAIGASAILGHEIKNPLAGIKGAAQLLSKRVKPTDTAMTDLIVNEVGRITRLLDQMQNLGRSSSGELGASNIHELIERAIRSIRAANAVMPSISINYDPSLPDVWIDADAMVQILINLIQNAIDALKETDFPEVGISTRFVMGGALREAEEKGSHIRAIRLPVEVCISDNGPGIAAHIEKELFSPFVTTKRDGQGLGLAIVRKLMTQMNSRIAVERDQAAQRTLFQLYLPVAGKDNLI